MYQIRATLKSKRSEFSELDQIFLLAINDWIDGEERTELKFTANVSHQCQGASMSEIAGAYLYTIWAQMRMAINLEAPFFQRISNLNAHGLFRELTSSQIYISALQSKMHHLNTASTYDLARVMKMQDKLTLQIDELSWKQPPDVWLAIFDLVRHVFEILEKNETFATTIAPQIKESMIAAPSRWIKNFLAILYPLSRVSEVVALSEDAAISELPDTQYKKIIADMLALVQWPATDETLDSIWKIMQDEEYVQRIALSISLKFKHSPENGWSLVPPTPSRPRRVIDELEQAELENDEPVFEESAVPFEESQERQTAAEILVQFGQLCQQNLVSKNAMPVEAEDLSQKPKRSRFRLTRQNAAADFSDTLSKMTHSHST